MVTLVLLGLAGTGALFAAAPVVGYALMLETCATRSVSTRKAGTGESPAREIVLATAA